MRWRFLGPAIIVPLVCVITLVLLAAADNACAQPTAAQQTLGTETTGSGITHTVYLPNLTDSPGSLSYAQQGHTDLGDWFGTLSVSQSAWRPGSPLHVEATLWISDSHLSHLQTAGYTVTKFVALLTAERTFDAEGHMRLGSDEKMSTLLTPSGLAIEGGMPGAVTNRFGYPFKTPVDEYKTVFLTETVQLSGQRRAAFSFDTATPGDLPPGIYRLRVDFGVMSSKRLASLNAETFAQKPFFRAAPTTSYLYSPPIPASGWDVSGQFIDGRAIQPRVPWILLGNYNSNGYKGVVAREDEPLFALSNRNIIQDQVVLPLLSGKGYTLTYSLEPQFPADTIDPGAAIKWNYQSGEFSIQVIDPSGRVADLGTAPFVSKIGSGASTGRPAFRAWRPTGYGRYAVVAKGWMNDIWGNRYEGGGTYTFWIAKRMTMATATFQGMSYPVGSKYGRDIGFSPAVPAMVTVTATLYPSSDTAVARSLTYSGQASPGGIFGAAQGMVPFALDAPGEYHAQILATYVDPGGHLWVCTMRHAGVVYPTDSDIVARGKKLYLNDQYVDRGETHFEGYVEDTGVSHLAHINYPYLSGDVLLIASELQGANKIEPVLTYEISGTTTPYDPKLRGVGTSNLYITTTNGLSPHLFPEFITDKQYFYSAAPRPGFMSRFLVGESITRAPYWPTSPNPFGSQIGASNNGDMPGDIYRLIGGVVLKPQTGIAKYAGYLSSAFVLPKGSMNNRVVAPGTEDLLGSDGTRHKFFLVGLRPGMVYETGTSFAAAAQIDPVLPVTVTFVITYPDGRTDSVQGPGDKFGSFVGSKRWSLDVPGIYRYWIEGEWQGEKGYMPGLPREGGEFYVVEKGRPAGWQGLTLDLATQSTFSVTQGLTITGHSSATEVHYAALIPGAVISSGTVPVINGRFSYRFDPAAVHAAVPTYDIENGVNGNPEIGRIVQLTFFAKETTPENEVWHDFARVILRGNQVNYAR